MGRIHTCRLSLRGVAAVLGMMILFARGPLGAEEKKGGITPATGSTPPPATSLPQPSAPKAEAKKPDLVQSSIPTFTPAGNFVVTSSLRAPFSFKIDPKTPLKDLLPTPPTLRRSAGPLLEDDLTRVPEITFQQALARNIPAGKALEATAHTMAKINHVNQKRTDAFMEALLGNRADLSGLPFAMGDSCRLKQERSRHFQQALNTVRQAMGPPALTILTLPNGATTPMSSAEPAPPLPAAGPVLPAPQIKPPQPSPPPRSEALWSGRLGWARLRRSWRPPKSGAIVTAPSNSGNATGVLASMKTWRTPSSTRRIRST
jgi:hypothetical protein